MKRTRESGALYRAWPEKVADDLVEIHAALKERDFERLGRAAESNALAMHATMLSAWPPVLYWLPESVRVMRDVWAARAEGVPVYFTMDAGPNIKLLFVEANRSAVLERFPDVRVVDMNEGSLA
jgi:diphosphomevalonate decarboxylase